jgi:hypothetical protein
MSAFAQLKAASPSLAKRSNCYASKVTIKALIITELSFPVPVHRLFRNQSLLNRAATGERMSSVGRATERAVERFEWLKSSGGFQSGFAIGSIDKANMESFRCEDFLCCLSSGGCLFQKRRLRLCDGS